MHVGIYVFKCLQTPTLTASPSGARIESSTLGTLPSTVERHVVGRYELCGDLYVTVLTLF